MKNVQAKFRNSSIELLRILAMFFIVISHASVHGGYPYDVESQSAFNSWFLEACVLGNLGTDLFILISGYFLCKKESTKASLPKLFSQVWFYSLACIVIYLLLGNSLSLSEIFKVIFPTLFGEYWFFTAYIALVLLVPYLNLFIEHLSRNQFRNFLILNLCLWVFVPSFTRYSMFVSEMTAFLLMYFIGAYFRFYPDTVLKKKSMRYVITTVSLLILLFLGVFLRSLSQFIPSALLYGGLYQLRTSLFIVLAAVGLFSIAVYASPFYNKGVNFLAGCTFGVYLFHDNPFLRGIVWGHWFNNTVYCNSPTLIIHVFISIVLIFVIGILFELVRQKFFKRTGDSIAAFILKPIEQFLE